MQTILQIFSCECSSWDNRYRSLNLLLWLYLSLPLAIDTQSFECFLLLWSLFEIIIMSWWRLLTFPPYAGAYWHCLSLPVMHRICFCYVIFCCLLPVISLSLIRGFSWCLGEVNFASLLHWAIKIMFLVKLVAHNLAFPSEECIITISSHSIISKDSIEWWNLLTSEVLVKLLGQQLAAGDTESSRVKFTSLVCLLEHEFSTSILHWQFPQHFHSRGQHRRNTFIPKKIIQSFRIIFSW